MKLCGKLYEKLMDNILITEARLRLMLSWAIWNNSSGKSQHEKGWLLIRITARKLLLIQLS